MSTETLLQDLELGGDDPDPYPPQFRIDRRTGTLELATQNEPFNRTTRNTKDVVLEWDNKKKRVKPWTWYVFIYSQLYLIIPDELSMKGLFFEGYLFLHAI